MAGRVIPFADRVAPRSTATERSSLMIAQVGRDQELLRLRAKVISSAGHAIHSMTPDQAVAEVHKVSAACVWVFCHTLEFYELGLLALAIRFQRPADKMVRLAGLNDGALPQELFDESLEPAKGVDDLLNTIAELARQTSRRKTGDKIE
jgi:hypothetical protein